MRYLLALCLGLTACQRSESVTASPEHESTDAWKAYAAWPEVTQGPRKYMAPKMKAVWTLCRAPLPAEGAPQRYYNPHATDMAEQKFTQVYANPKAWAQMRAAEPWSFEPGSMIVKTKGTEDPKTKASAVVGIGAMIKRESGYDPDGGDWEYLYAEVQNEKVVSVQRGKLQSCKKCHDSQKVRDHLYMTYLSLKQP